MARYVVRAERRDGGWDLSIEGVGVTRVDRLTSADRAVRSQLDVLGHARSDEAELALVHTQALEREVRVVRESRAAADAANRYAAERSRELAARLAADGNTGAEIALVLGITPQRVSQLLATPAPKPAEVVDLRTPEEKAARKAAKPGKKDGKKKGKKKRARS